MAWRTQRTLSAPCTLRTPRWPRASNQPQQTRGGWSATITHQGPPALGAWRQCAYNVLCAAAVLQHAPCHERTILITACSYTVSHSGKRPGPDLRGRRRCSQQRFCRLFRSVGLAPPRGRCVAPASMRTVPALCPTN